MRPLLFIALVVAGTGRIQGAEVPLVEKYLVAGDLAEGKLALTKRLSETPGDEEARFGLGVLEFFQAIEHLGQSLYRYGAVGPETRLGRQIPLLRLAVPKNPAPAEIRYADLRAMLAILVDELAVAEATLAKVKNPQVKLPLHFGLIALDLTGDGKAGGEETLWRLYAKLNGGLRLTPEFTPEAVQNFVIAFDYGDALWLRGYCHLLSAISEMVLAYYQEPFFLALGDHLFAKVATPQLPDEPLQRKGRDWEGEIADAIAAIHLAHFTVKEPERMKRSREHFLEVIRLSRESWAAIETETDDDHEWLPNPKQHGVIPNVRVTQEMIDGWRVFLKEAELLLAGKKLVPHWRFAPEYGINLKRVFQEPREFDLVLWAHGAGALPYAEKGETSSSETWWRLERLFGGQFIGFAFWFN